MAELSFSITYPKNDKTEENKKRKITWRYIERVEGKIVWTYLNFERNAIYAIGEKGEELPDLLMTSAKKMGFKPKNVTIVKERTISVL